LQAYCLATHSWLFLFVFFCARFQQSIRCSPSRYTASQDRFAEYSRCSVYKWLVEFLSGRSHCVPHTTESFQRRWISRPALVQGLVQCRSSLTRRPNDHSRSGKPGPEIRRDTCIVILACNIQCTADERELLAFWAQASNLKYSFSLFYCISYICVVSLVFIYSKFYLYFL